MSNLACGHPVECCGPIHHIPANATATASASYGCRWCASLVAKDRDRDEALAAARREEREAIRASTNPPADEFLEWVADRFVYRMGESPNMDYVLALRRLAAAIRAREEGER